MLASSRTTRLCTKCRQDLLSIFERGFCTSTLPRPIRAPSHPGKIRHSQTWRKLSNSPRLLQLKPETDQLETTADQHQGSEASVDQLNAIKELERVLGKPLDDAIEEDQLASIARDDVSKYDEDPSEGAVHVEALEDQVVTVRKTGADAEDVVRAARQTHGEYLPDGVLEEHETIIYKRLYGDPEPEMEDEPEVEEDEEYVNSGNELLDQDGDPVDDEAIGAHTGHSQRSRQARREESEDADEDVLPDSSTQGRLDLSDTLQSRITSIANAVDGHVVDDSTQHQDMEDDELPHQREHALTRLGKFGTRPSTVYMPKEEYVLPFLDTMSKYSNKHLKDVCERAFGGGGLPDSPLTPRSGKFRQQIGAPLEASQYAMSEMEANAFMTAVVPPAYAAITSVLVETRKRLGPTWLTELLAKEGGPRVLDAGAGGAGVLAWNEVVKAHWEALHTSDKEAPSPPPTKAVVLTGSDALRHRSADLLTNTTFIPRFPDYNRTRDSPTLDDDRPAQKRKQFDVVIVPYSLLPIKEDWEKKVYVQNLWSLVSSSGGVLILIEKGIPRGFEAIAGARELLLDRYIASPQSHSTHYSTSEDIETDSVHEKSTGSIVAPCTNHTSCPLYRVPGISQGRKDFCSFQQRYIRPPHLQRVLGAKDRNYDDVDFSYLSVMKGRDLRQHQLSTFEHIADPLSAPSTPDPSTATGTPIPSESWLETCQDGFSASTPTPETSTSTMENPVNPPMHLLPRLIFPPMKRRGHILLDVCTPLGTLERWTVPRSFGKQPYRDARKSQWGDLWALGAKTRVPRSAKVGVGSKEVREMMKRLPGGGGGRGIGTGVGGASGGGGSGTEGKVPWVGKGRNREERLKNQAVKLVQKMEDEKDEEREEKRMLEKDLADEFDVPISEVKHAMRDTERTTSSSSSSSSKASAGSSTGSSSGQKKKAAGRNSNNDDDDAHTDTTETPANIESAWKEWQDEYAADDATSGLNRKRGGSYRTHGVGKSSKAAKRMQKEMWAKAMKAEKEEKEEV